MTTNHHHTKLDHYHPTPEAPSVPLEPEHPIVAALRVLMQYGYWDFEREMIDMSGHEGGRDVTAAFAVLRQYLSAQSSAQ